MDELVKTGASLSPVAPLNKGPLEPERHPVAVYLARLTSRSSRETMRGAIKVIAEILSGGQVGMLWIDWAALRYPHTAAIRSALSQRYAPTTANKMLSALRGVLEEAWRLGLMAAEDYQRARDVPAIRAEVLPRGRALGTGELRALMAACTQEPATPAGLRDAAMIGLLYGTGLRRSEVVALDLSDVELGTGALRIRSGKGRKDRMVYARGGAAEALSVWLEWRGSEDGPLFLPLSKSGNARRTRLTGQAVLYVLRRRGRQAGIRGFSPHDLRRTFVGDLLEAGADISTVQRLAGHASVQTTARYDRRGEQSKSRAAELLHVPYSRPAGMPARRD